MISEGFFHDTMPNTKPDREGSNKAPGQKTRKANSEARKQQNRIASRNYREKRKRKLERLQNLLHEEQTNERQTSSVSPQPSESYASSVSVDCADYAYSESSPSPYTAPLSSGYEINPTYTTNMPLPTGSAVASTPSSSMESTFIPVTHQLNEQQRWDAPVYHAVADLSTQAWRTSPWPNHQSAQPALSSHLLSHPLTDSTMSATVPITPPHAGLSETVAQQPPEPGFMSDAQTYVFGCVFESSNSSVSDRHSHQMGLVPPALRISYYQGDYTEPS